MSESINESNDFKNVKVIIFIVAGTIVISAVAIWGIINRQFIKNAATAKGVVVKLNAGGSHPEIKFTTNDGKIIEYPQGGLISGYNTGDEVTVLYDSQNPHNAVINDFGALWGFSLLAFVLGVSVVCVGMFLKFM